MPENKRLWFGVFAAVSIIYVALRIWRLADSCLWFDEVFSLHAAGLDFRPMFGLVLADLIHPPFFYLLLKLWISAGGESLLWVRLFPVLFSAVSLIPFFGLSKQLKLSNPAIALALSFFAVNGYLIKYAQEVRMYSLLMFLSLFSVWLLARLLNYGKGIWLLTLINILLIHTHYFGWFVIFSEILAVVILQRAFLRQILMMTGCSAVSFIPWTVTVLQRGLIDSEISQNLGWAERPGIVEILRLIFNLNEPFYYKASSIGAFSQFVITLPVLFVLLALFGLYIKNKKQQSDRDKTDILFLTIIIAAPVMISFAVSWLFPFSVWGTRHFIIVFAPFTILLAKLFDLIPGDKTKIAIALCLFLLFVFAFVLNVRSGKHEFIWCGWESVARQMPLTASNGPARIFAFEDEAAYLLWFALRNTENIVVFKVDGIRELPEDRAFFLPRGFEQVKRTAPAGMNGDKFYIAFRALRFDRSKEPLRGLLENGYTTGKPFSYEAQGLTVFLVEIRRDTADR